ARAIGSPLLAHAFNDIKSYTRSSYVACKGGSMTNRIRTSSTFMLLCFLSFSQAEELSYDTDWLSPEAGFKEKKMGARIDSVTEMKKEGMQRIEISLPETENPIEEVIVIGKRVDAPEKIIQSKRFEYVNDLKSGRSGIIIYIGKRQKFALKFNYDEGNARFPYD
ncbi:MAG: hypothetical protein ACR2P1_07125, partial [Pseudomonadales bacterium]